MRDALAWWWFSDVTVSPSTLGAFVLLGIGVHMLWVRWRR